MNTKVKNSYLVDSLIFVFLSLIIVSNLSAQTTLSAGDLMMVTVNADGDKNFDFVPLEDLESNTEILFTDNAWDGSALKTNEGTLTYTASSSVSAGTIVSYSGSAGGVWSSSGSFNPSGSGDNIIVYQGSTGSETFIYGIGWARGTSWISSGTVTTNNSYVPTGLSTDDNTIINLSTSDNYQYDTSNGTSGPKSTLRYLTAQTGNYNGNNSTAYSALSGSFNVGQVISGSSNHYRMMSSPVAGTVYDDILGPLWIQGMTNGDVTSDSANVWTYDAANTEWDALSDLNTASLTAGQGFLVYVFSDVDNDGDDDLPVYLSVSGTENSGSFEVPSSGANLADAAWLLAGNPYASTIDWDLVEQTHVTTSAYVWDSQAGTPAYISWNGSGSISNGLIAPYQGFFVQTDTDWESGTEYQFQADAKSGSAGTFYKTMADNTGSMSFTITSGEYSNKTFVSFMNSGEEGMDNADAYKLLPMFPSERVVGISYAEGNGLDISNLPYSHDGSISIPLDIMYLTLDEDYDFVTQAEDVNMTWDLSSLPEHISMTLTDNITGNSVDLTQQSEVTFATVEKGSFPAYGSGGVSIYPQVGESRFTLTAAYSPLSAADEATNMPKEFALHPAYPNPFNPSTTITFDVPLESRYAVSLQLYDIKGQLVETLINEVLPAGQHSIQWSPKTLASGLYIVQLKAGQKTFNQKITFIK